MGIVILCGLSIKDIPGILFWAILPLHLLMNITNVIYFSLRDQAKAILRAKYDALRGIPQT